MKDLYLDDPEGLKLAASWVSTLGIVKSQQLDPSVENQLGTY